MKASSTSMPSLHHQFAAILAIAGMTVSLVPRLHGQELPIPGGRPLTADVSPIPDRVVPEAVALPWTPPPPTLSDDALRQTEAPALRKVVFPDLSGIADREALLKSGFFTSSYQTVSKKLENQADRELLTALVRDIRSPSMIFERRDLNRFDEVAAQIKSPGIRFALALEKGEREWRNGWFLKGIEGFEQAWKLGKAHGEEIQQVDVWAAFARLLNCYQRLGQKDKLKSLLGEVDPTELNGSAFEAYSDATQILWHLENRAEQNIFCGFTALNAICLPLGQRPAFPDVHDEKEKQAFIADGLSVFELIAHSRESGGKVTAYRRPPGGEWAAPSVVHWGFGHYSAVTKVDETGCFVNDEHLNFYGRIDFEAMDAQASGVVIVPEGVEVPKGYMQLSDDEAKRIFGRHCSHGVDDEGCVGSTGKCGNRGMAGHSFTLLEPGLSISDTPIAHTSPFGPSIPFTVSYFQRRNGTGQSPVPTNAGNLGPLWSHGYLNFVEILGTGTPSSAVNVVDGTGMYSRYTSPSGNVYSRRFQDRPNLEWLATGGFKLSYADGSCRFFTQPNSATPSRYFLSEIRDSAGNKLVFGYDGAVRLSSITNDLGQAMVIGYTPEAGDNVTSDTFKIRSVTDPFGRVAKFKYNSAGQLYRIIDTIGITSEFAYGPNDFVKQLTTPYGVTKFASGSLPNSDGVNGRFIRATDPQGDVEYAEAFEKVGLLPDNDADMLALQGGNESAGVQIDVGGQNVSFLPKNDYLFYRNTFYWSKKAWHHGGRNINNATIYNWLASGDNVTGVLGSIKSPDMGRVWFNYKGQTSASSPGTYGAAAKTVRLVETTGGQTKWIMDQTDYEATYGLPTRSIDPLGREMVYEYSGMDLTAAKLRTGPGANDFTTLTTLSNYNSAHLPQSVTDASGVTRNFTYNSRGQVTAITMLKGGSSETTEYTYRRLDGTTTNEGYLTSVRHSDPANPSQTVEIASLTYDSAKRVRTVTGVESDTLTYDYDNMDRVRLITHPDGSTEQFEYDRLSLNAQKNRAGEWSRTFHNGLGQPVFTVDAEGRVTSFEWCRCGALRKLIDARGSVTQWKRLIDGRVLEKIAQDGSKTTYSYQARSGRLASVTRPKDQAGGNPTLSLTYTLDGMTSGVDYTDAGTPDVSFGYLDGNGRPDPLGRPTSWTDPIGTTTYSYIPLNGSNGAGQIYEENGPMADDTIRRGYDWRGVETLREVRSDGGSVLHSSTTTLDTLGRLTQAINDLGSFSATYNPGNLSGKMNLWSRPGGMVTQFDWYPASAGNNSLGLKEIHHVRAGTTISKFGYQYDSAKRITQWSRQLDANPANARTWTMGYSRAGELTGLVETTPLGSETSRSTWNYDPAGNWYAEGGSNATVHRTHDAMNRLNQIGGAGRTMVEGELDEPGTVTVDGQPATVTGIPGTDNFTFRREIAVQEGANNFTIAATDANGNRTTQTYSVQVGGTQTTYGYDANGNLLWEKDAGGVVLRSFEWDAADRLRAVNWGTQRVEWAYDAMGKKVSESVNGTLVRRFLWDGIELLLERSGSGSIQKKFYGEGEIRVGGVDAGTYLYTRDHLGSVREVMKLDGTLQARYDYDAYGRRMTITQNPNYLGGCDFGYTGHFTRTALVAGRADLVLTHFRVYDPELGRWLSADPIGEMGGLNLYGYVGGNPIKRWDPLGLCWEDDLRKGLTLAGSALGTGLGFLGGGGGGALASVPTAGVAAPATVPAGAIAGAAGGAVVGAAVGAVAAEAGIALAHFASRWSDDSDDNGDGFCKMPQGDNTAKNKQFNDALKALKIPKGSPLARRLHEAITGRGLGGYKDIVNFGRQNGFQQ